MTAAVNDLGDTIKLGLYSPLANLFLLILVVALNLYVIYLSLRALLRREERPLLSVIRQFRHSVGFRRIFEVVFPLILISLFNSVFTSFKAIYSHINPFYLDPYFAKIDRLIHGGIEPWQLTHSLITTPTGTLVVDAFYTVWLLVMWGFMGWHLLRLNQPMERYQFLLSYVLCWSFIGTLAAYALSSAGPCYYGLVTGNDGLYAPLMEQLQLQKEALLAHHDWRDISALNAQEYLWNSHLAGVVAPGGGISAMPSMHVSMAVLFTLSAWKKSRVFAAITGGYALMILFGSVHLGWHYAIDGYVAILATVLLWFVSGWMARRIVLGKGRWIEDVS